VITIRVLLLLTRAKSAVALAVSEGTGDSERTELLRVADTTLHAMEQTQCGWAMALALSIRASVASCRGRASDALRLLDRAAADLQAVELMPWYYAARWHLASERERVSKVAEPVDEWWTTERIVKPQLIANLLIPGKWPERVTHTQRSPS